MSRLKKISPAEYRVLVALTSGSLYKEIANDLSISINTVKKHLKNIYKKLPAENRIEAIKIFLEESKITKQVQP